MLVAVVDTGFCGAGGGTGFLTVALACAVGVLATTGTGLAVVVGVVAAVAAVAFRVVAAFATGTAAVEAAPVVCFALALVGDIDEVPGFVVAAEVVPAPVAGAQGAALAVLAAAGGAVAAAFFLPKIDPRFENAVVAFETALLALAGT